MVVQRGKRVVWQQLKSLADRLQMRPMEFRDFVITVDRIGVQVRNTFRRTEPSAPLAVRWDQVDTIILFNRDFEASDCVCMSLEGAGEVLGEINEEMTGWNDIVTALPAQFEGVMPANQWQDAVYKPQRRPRAAVIYERRRKVS